MATETDAKVKVPPLIVAGIRRPLSKADMCELFGVDERTIERWIAAKKLPPPLRVGKRKLFWRAEVIEKFLADGQAKK